MGETENRDNRNLIDFWDKTFARSMEERENRAETEIKSPDRLAPSEKLYAAACSLGKCKKVLDYGCGSGWAGIIAAKSGCGDVTMADVASGAVHAAKAASALYGTKDSVQVIQIGQDWLNTLPSGTYDGLICSNVLDVIPPATAENIIREFARVLKDGSEAVIGMNYYLSADEANERGLELKDGRLLYVDNILRLVSRTDGEWEQIFSPWFEIKCLEHFAWPGESKERRRLYYLRKRNEE